MTDLQKHVEALMKKAGESTDKDDAMRYSQAALNVAHALHVLGMLKRGEGM